MPVWLLGAWCVAVAFWDMRWRRIPNLLLLCLTVPVLTLLVLRGHGPLGAGWFDSGIGAAIGGACWLPGYRLGKVAGGDVKLALCIGLAVGALRCLEAMLVAAVVLGVMAVAAAVARQGRRLPAGVALAGGMVWVLFRPEWPVS